MKMRFMIVLAVVLAAAVTGCSRKDDPIAAGAETTGREASGTATSEAAKSVWLTDFEAAKAQAAEEGKDLLVDFSGSDWCYWCKKLDGEVFSKPGFVDSASREFVFVKIDFPRDKSHQSADLQAQNLRLSRTYEIQGYPTVILMRADGTPYAQTGYQEGGADVYLDHLKDLRQQR